MIEEGTNPAKAGRVPASRRGRETRERIVAAATAIFERDGYIDTRVADIVAEAGVAHGTFYRYFDSKTDVFRECALVVAADLYKAHDLPAGLDPLERIRIANRRFIDLYDRNRRMLALIEQVATFSEELREVRKEIRHHGVARVAGAIAKLNANGRTATPQLDPVLAASALGGMVDNFCYWWFGLEESFDRDEAIATLDRLWIRGVGLEQPQR